MNTNLEYKKNKINTLTEQVKQLEEQFQDLCKNEIFAKLTQEGANKENKSIDNDCLLKKASEVNKNHIQHLRKYNQLRDTGLLLLDLVAKDKEIQEAKIDKNSNKTYKVLDLIKEMGYDSTE
ncbi:hypothetical protein ACO0SA_000668 [Hanseniaspora valbyensis]